MYRCYGRLGGVLLGLLLVVGRVQAVDGIAVGIANGAEYLRYYGAKAGELWRYDIESDAVVQETRLIATRTVSEPRISPDGRNIAFLTGKQVKVIPVSGGNATSLTTAHENSYLDFPSPDWVYFSTGTYFDKDEAHTIKRVNIASKRVETVISLGGDNRISQFGISNDLKRAAIRPGDNSGSRFKGKMVAYDIVAQKYGAMLNGGDSYSCAGGIFSDGKNAMDGNGGHTGFDIRNWENGDKVTSFRNTTALGWPPNNGARASGGHAIFHSDGATNHPNWMCIVTGNDPRSACGSGENCPRDDRNRDQLVINWKDKKCIWVNKKMREKGHRVFDHGDFWVGAPTSVLGKGWRGADRGQGTVIQTSGNIFLITGGRGFIEISDARGRVVYSKVVHDERFVWDQRDQWGMELPAGTYLVQVTTFGRTSRRRLTVVP